MMQVVERMLLRQAIEMSSVIGDHSEKILDLTKSFLSSEYGLDLPIDDVKKALDKESTARLFFACGKARPEEINNPQNCLRLARNLWLDYFIATSKGNLSEQKCMKAAEEKFILEKEQNSTLDSKTSPLTANIRLLFSTGNALEEYRTYLQSTVQYFQVAFYVLEEFFNNRGLTDIFQIYNPFATEENNQEIVEVVETIKTEEKETTGKKDSRVKYLEKTIHDLKVKLEHTQKDAIRDIAMTLASSAYGAPLFELNSIKKSENTPDNVVSAISNLFLALESMDIRISKDRLVGTVMPFNEIEQGKYCLQNDETLDASDFVKVKYPAIKLGKETIVRPTIVKENNYNE